MKMNTIFWQITRHMQRKEQEGIRFETSEKMEEITTITKDLNQMDKNWKWSTKVEDRLNLPFPESVIEMHWDIWGI